MKSPLVIGLVGEKGSGKETVAGMIREILTPNMPLTLTLSPLHGARGSNRGLENQQPRAVKIVHVKFSDLLRETLEIWGLPVTRTHLQDLAVIIDQHFGEGTLANAIYKRIEKLDTDVVILDGIRWEADVLLLKRFENHKLIYVTANLTTRYERISKRTEKDGEGKDFKQFLKEEKAKNELLIPKIGSMADFRIENDGTVSQLAKKVALVIDQINAAIDYKALGNSKKSK